MTKGLFELLERHTNLEAPIQARLKALGLSLCANLPPAFRLVDLRYIQPNRELPEGYYFIAEYSVNHSLCGFCLHEEELTDATIIETIEWVVNKTRKAAISRIIL